MKKTTKPSLIKKLALPIGILGMILVLAGFFIENNLILQQSIFLAGSLGLAFSAIINRQKMYIALQGIIIAGILLGFFELEASYKYLIMALPVIVAYAYLIRIKYFKSDSWGILGSLGLIAVAFGYALNSQDYPLLFNIFLFSGGIIVAAYSAIGFFHYKIRITMLWLVLNLAFAIKPAMYLISVLWT